MKMRDMALWAVVCMAVSFVDTSAQNTGLQVGVGGGISVITGTPERPAPRGEDKLTGASGPNAGVHIRALAQHALLGDRIFAGGELFWNRLSTSGLSLNCLSDHNEALPVPGKYCYPGARTDQTYGAMVFVRAMTGGRHVRPMVSVSAGAARFALEPDPFFEELQPVQNIRPIYGVGTGADLIIAGIHAMLEASFHGSIGQGGGTHNIPITLTFLF